MNKEISHKKKQPEDLKIQKPLSLFPLKFDEVVDILLATTPKRLKTKEESKQEHITRGVKTA